MVTLKIKLEPSNRFNQSMYSIFIPPQNPAISRVLNSKLSGNIPIYCENKLIILRLAEQIQITDVVIENMMNWCHSGFGVYCGGAIWPRNEAGHRKPGTLHY